MKPRSRAQATRHPATDDSHAAGQSAQQEYERRRSARRARVRARYGPVGTAIAALVGEPRHVSVWQQGADGEIETARRLEAHLRRTAVTLLHDRRIPGRGHANLDHITIGPGGITVIDSKSSRGHVELATVGVLKRRDVLLVNGWDRTGELDRLERQVRVVSERLRRNGVDAGEVLGALCFPFMRRAWPHRARARGGLLVVDDPRHVAKVARRPGVLSDGDIAELARVVANVFPAATR